MYKAESEVKPTRPNLHFFFLAHRYFGQCSEKLLPELVDRDIVFMETVNLQGDSRQRTEASINLILASPESLNPEETQLQAELIKVVSQSDNYVSRLAYHLAGTGKLFYFVDIDEGHPAFPMIEKSHELINQVIESLKEGNLPRAESLHQEYVATRATLHQIRETEVKNQITSIVSHLQQAGVTIRAAVIQGAIHQSTANIFTENGYDIETTVLSEQTLEGELWLKKRLGLEPTNADYRRALLVFILLENYDLESDFDAKVHQELALLVNRLSDNQIDLTMREFEQTYRQNLARLTNRRRLTPVDRKDFAPAVFSLTIGSLLRSINRLLKK